MSKGSETKDNTFNFSEELIDRLISIAFIAIGNILIVVGENLTEKGRERMNSAGGEDKKNVNMEV